MFHPTSCRLRPICVGAPAKRPHGPGSAASSPARVPLTTHLTELVALDAGRRGRLRSQDRGAFLLACRESPNTNANIFGTST